METDHEDAHCCADLSDPFVAPAAPSYASAARNPRHDSDRGKQNYDPIYKGYPLSRWYWYG
jgi:hypothetical protein